MKRLTSALFGALLITAASICPLTAQVTIGSALKANNGAILDLKEDNNQGPNSNKGLLLPRVNLEEIDQLYPMFGTSANIDPEYSSNKTDLDLTHIGLTVYNLTTDLQKGLCEGVYVWNVSK